MWEFIGEVNDTWNITVLWVDAGGMLLVAKVVSTVFMEHLIRSEVKFSKSPRAYRQLCCNRYYY